MGRRDRNHLRPVTDLVRDAPHPPTESHGDSDSLLESISDARRHEMLRRRLTAAAAPAASAACVFAAFAASVARVAAPLAAFSLE